GMRMEQTRQDYLRAVIEGIGFNLDLILDAYRKKIPVDRMTLTGGGAKGQAVCQVLADVFGLPLTTPDHAGTATSIAAAVIAGVGIGVYPDFQAVRHFLHADQTYAPVMEHHALYQKIKPVFDDCYHALTPVYDRLDALHV
ncbi:MAG: FGGY-family carbohydrate kinase, partial [Bilifractor sp.]